MLSCIAIFMKEMEPHCRYCSFFSVSMFCSIGLPGFAVVIVLGVTSTVFIVTSSLVIDKVGQSYRTCMGTKLYMAPECDLSSYSCICYDNIAIE